MTTQPIIDEQKLIDALPHGSGIDCDWHTDALENGAVIARNSYYLMDENGMYCGRQDFSVKVFAIRKTRYHALKGPCAGQYQVTARKGDIDFSIQFNGHRQRCAAVYGLREMLGDTIHYALSEAKILTSRNEALTAEQYAAETAAPKYRDVIRDSAGNIIRRSKNLAGIIKHARNKLIKRVDISPLADSGGKLMVLFDNGDNFETNFGSYDVLFHWVASRRSWRGAPLSVNGVDVGTISKESMTTLEK